MSVPLHPSLSQIDMESGKKVGASLDQIRTDWRQMREENTQLAARLKA